MKDITMEIPNDWEPNLCYACASKEHFKKRKEALPKEQKTIWDSLK
jgi:hypothetical protein